MQMHLHYMHILSILFGRSGTKKEPQRDSCTAVSASFAVSPSGRYSHCQRI